MLSPCSCEDLVNLRQCTVMYCVIPDEGIGLSRVRGQRVGVFFLLRVFLQRGRVGLMYWFCCALLASRARAQAGHATRLLFCCAASRNRSLTDAGRAVGTPRPPSKKQHRGALICLLTHAHTEQKKHKRRLFVGQAWLPNKKKKHGLLCQVGDP